VTLRVPGGGESAVGFDEMRRALFRFGGVLHAVQ
jgi:hypothetical protein